MTFGDALDSIVKSTTRDAMKRPNWGGYIYRGAVNGETGAYTLTFKTRSGTTTAYSYSGSAWTAPGTPLGIDAELMEALASDDWTTGVATDFEAARSGNGVW